MPHIDLAALQQAILTLEQQRTSRVLVLAATHLEMEHLPALYEHCQAIGQVERLDVVLHARGGVVNAARRIALLLRSHARHLSFIVPYHCESAATLLTLCGDQIVAGELALFSPVDPQLNGENGSAFSALDIQQFGSMAQQWFGLDGEAARAQALALLCNSVFPPSLTAFYRTTLEMAEIGQQLLAWQLPQHEPAQREQIVQKLMAGYHSHNYALSGDDMAALGLQVQRDAASEASAWAISKMIQACVGAGLRNQADAPWIDALFARRDSVALRHKQAGGMAAQWQWEALA